MARKRGKLLNAAILSIRDMKTVQGEVGELKQLIKDDGTPAQSKAFGTDLYTLDIISDKGEVKTFWADAGLRGSFQMAKIKPGMFLEINHTGEKDITTSDGKAATVQTYEIYELTKE